MPKKGQAQGRAIRTRILSVVVSLALSFFLWLALSGQDTTTTDLSVPLELANLPANLTVRSDLPTSVTFQVMANTAQLRFLSDRKLQVWINAASAREGYNAYPVDPDSLDLPRGVQVRRVTPQIIEFEAVKTGNKTVPLKPTVSGAVDPAYRVRAILMEPDRVMVQGPRELLEGLTELNTAPISLEGLTRSTNLVVTPAVADLDSSLVVSPREIKVLIDVEERSQEETFKGLPIEVDCKNGERSDNLTLSPTKVDITVSWPASRARAVTPGEVRIRVYVDLDKLRAETSQTLPVVAVPPAGATVTAINPTKVMVSLPPVKQPEPSGSPAADSASDPAETSGPN